MVRVSPSTVNITYSRKRTSQGRSPEDSSSLTSVLSSNPPSSPLTCLDCPGIVPRSLASVCPLSFSLS